MAAVSVAEAVREVTGIPLGIKWPNDLLLPDGRKVCGILTEMSAEAEQIHFIVLGIGLNVSHREADFPEDLRSVAGSLAMLMDGKAPSRIALVQSILGHLEEDYDLFCRSGGFAALRSRWEAYNVTIGRKIAVQTVRGRITGWARRIDDEGALWIDDGTGREEKIISAEVMFESV
jgi:BirA family biotin operon repressor/biotin-[acetyl-CoA-carboxylase] ligase